MPPIPTFAEWSEKVRNRKWSRPEDRYFDYVRRVLFAPRRYPDFYSEEQAKQDFFSDLQSVLDQSAEKLRDRLAKKQPIPKGGQVRGKTDNGKTDAGKTDSGGSENPTRKGDQRKSGGSGHKSFSVEQSVKQEGNQIQAKKEKPEPFDNKTEFGNIELQSVFVRMAKNPDLSLKSDTEKELPDDRHQWGIVRPARVMNVAKDNITEWNSAHPGSVWLGFVRIGRRVDQDEDKLALMQLVETLDGRKFAIPRKELRAGEPWHQVWLDQKFDAQKDPKIKVWNGWTLDALKKDKELRMSETGCFYGFFLVKATEKNPNHYFNFRCASLNQFANATFTDYMPSVPPKQMKREQIMAFRNLIESARGGFSPRLDELNKHFPDGKFHRGAVEVDDSSKKMPRSWAKAVVDTIHKL